jgi:hypothetical protein
MKNRTPNLKHPMMMKNLLCFLIPTITIAAIISDIGKSAPTFTYPTTSNVVILPDIERATATHHLTRHH